MYKITWEEMSGQGESFESEPNECIGNNGYHPPICWVSDVIFSKLISAPPNP